MTLPADLAQRVADRRPTADAVAHGDPDGQLIADLARALDRPTLFEGEICGFDWDTEQLAIHVPGIEGPITLNGRVAVLAATEEQTS